LVLVDTRFAYIPGARLGVKFLLLTLQRLGGMVALGRIADRADSLPSFGGVLFNLFEGRLARILKSA
jgi:hypothetical protein